LTVLTERGGGREVPHHTTREGRRVHTGPICLPPSHPGREPPRPPPEPQGTLFGVTGRCTVRDDSVVSEVKDGREEASGQGGSFQLRERRPLG